MRPPRFGTGTLMLLVAAAALAAALVVQHYRAARREFWLRAELHRLTPAPCWGGAGKMVPVGDRLVIVFDPQIYQSEPGARYRWRFELAGPSGGAAVLSYNDGREYEVPAGMPFSPDFVEVLDRPPPGNYVGRFILSYLEPADTAASGWKELTAYSDTIVIPPRAEGPTAR